MNRLSFKTLNSTYILDRENGTWERTATNGVRDPYNPMRTENGVMWAHSDIRIGEPAVIYGPPIEPGTQMRVIATTEVTEIVAGYWDSGQFLKFIEQEVEVEDSGN